MNTSMKRNHPAVGASLLAGVLLLACGGTGSPNTVALAPSAPPADPPTLVGEACGPVALQAALRELGSEQPLAPLYAASGTVFDRSSSLGLAHGAQTFGFSTRLVMADLDDLARVASDPAVSAVLNLSNNHHFMVLRDVGPELVTMWDGTLPSAARSGDGSFRFLRDSFAEQFDGRTLLIARSAEALSPYGTLATLDDQAAHTNWGASACSNSGSGAGDSASGDGDGESADPVQLGNGNFFFPAVDLSIAGVGPQLRMERRYDAQVVSRIAGLSPREFGPLQHPEDQHGGPHVVDGGRFVLHGDLELTNDQWPETAGATATLAADIEVLEPGANETWERARLMFRYDDIENYQFADFLVQADGILVRHGRHDGGLVSILGHGLVPFAELPAGAATAAEHRLEARFGPSRVDLFVDGVSAYAAESEEVYGPGRVGLESYFSASAFDNVEIGELDADTVVVLRQWSFDGQEPDFILGHGWTTPFTEHLEFEDTGDVRWVKSTGATAMFQASGGGAFSSPSELSGQLAAVAGGFELRRPSGLTHHYRADGKLEAIADANGNRVAVTYDDVAGREVPTLLTDAVGRSLELTYDATLGKITTVTDPLGREVHYRYDARGDLIEVEDAQGHVEYYEYDAYHRMTRFESKRQRCGDDGAGACAYLMTYRYNSRIDTQTDPDGNVLVFDYLWSQVQAVNSYGEQTSYFFADNGKVRAIVDPLGNVQGRETDDAGVALSHVDAQKIRTSFIRDEHDRVRQHLAGADDATVPPELLETWSYCAPGVAGCTELLNRIDRPISHVDALGRETTWSYDAVGNVARIDHPDETHRELEYDARGNVVSLVDERGGEWTYAYDAHGHLASATDPEGAVTTYEHDLVGRMTSESPAAGPRVELAYDALDRLTSRTYDDGTQETFTYDETGNLLTATDRTAAQWSFEYDWARNRRAAVSPEGRRWTFDYDNVDYLLRGSPRLVGSSTPHGAERSHEYDDAGRRVLTTDSVVGETNYVYDAKGRLTSVTDPAGGATSVVYDHLGRTRRFVDDGSTVAVSYAPGTTDLRSLTDPAGHETLFETDARGLISGIVYADESRDAYGWDGLGAPTSLESRAGAGQQFTYDAAGRILSEDLPSGTVEYTYDDAGHLTEVEDLVGQWSYAYDDEGRTVRETNPDGVTVTYAYDGAGRVVDLAVGVACSDDGDTLCDSAGSSYTYDGEGRLTAVSDTDAGQWTFTYPAATSSVIEYPSGVTQTDVVDAAGRVSSVTVESGAGVLTSQSYTYDALGNPTRVDTGGAGPGESLVAVYNTNSEVLSAVSGTRAETFSYDAAGNRTSSTGLAPASAGEASAVPSAVGTTTNPLAVQQNVGFEFTPEVDIELTELGGAFSGDKTVYLYDSAGTVLRQAAVRATSDWSYAPARTAGGDVASVVLEAGERYSVSVWVDGDGGIEYPGVEFPVYVPGVAILSSCFRDNSTLEPCAAGRSQTSLIGTPDFRFRVPTDATIPLAYAADSVNRYSTVSSTHLEYDAAGNLISDGASVFAYDARGRLLSVERPGHRVEYAYDWRDRKYSRTETVGERVTQTLFAYAGLDPIAEYDGEVERTARYVIENRIDARLAIVNADGMHYVHRGRLGSTLALTGADGAVVEHVRYSAFGFPFLFGPDGEPHADSVVGNRFLFTGREWEAEFGIYDYRARAYSPALGRFLQPDPLRFAGGDHNLYRYVGNSPWTARDPLGLSGDYDPSDNPLHRLSLPITLAMKALSMAAKLPGAGKLAGLAGGFAAAFAGGFGFGSMANSFGAGQFNGQMGGFMPGVGPTTPGSGGAGAAPPSGGGGRP